MTAPANRRLITEARIFDGTGKVKTVLLPAELGLTTAEVQAIIADTVFDPTGILITSNAEGDAILIDASGSSGGLTVEDVRDTIAAALVAGSNVLITPNDAGDTITISATGGGGGDGGFMEDLTDPGFFLSGTANNLGWLNVKDPAYGAKGDAVTNDTAAVQAAIDAATVLAHSGDPYGGIVFFPPGHYVLGQITLKSRVQLIGAPMNGQGYRETPVRLVPHSSIPDDGFMFIQSGTITNVVMAGLSSYGEGPTSKTGWINLPSVDSCSFHALYGDNWGIEAFILGGNNNRVSYSMFEGLWNRTYIAAGTTVRGAFTLSGGDHQISHSEFTGPVPPGTAVSSSAFECAAAKFTMSSSEVDTCVFQLGDVGLNLAGGIFNRFVGDRFDYNAAHGLWVTDGTIMMFDGCSWNHNSSAATNTYDHINVPSGGGSPLQFISPMFSNDGLAVKYWINDAKNHVTFRNTYLQPHGEAATTANTNITGNSIVNYPSLMGSATWDPASINSGAAANTTVTVSGATPGDTVLATHSSVQTAATSWILTGYVSAADTVRVVLFNATGGAVDLASGTLRVRVFKQ